ncbi:MAG: metallophosphoesterase [Halobacteriaceae archaeon]
MLPDALATQAPRFADRAVYLSGVDALVVADLHAGRARSARVALPVADADDRAARLGALCRQFDPATVVVAGDVVDAPGGDQSPVERVAGAVADTGADLVVTPGNHDGQLSGFGGAAPAVWRDGRVAVCHGHEAPDAAGADLVVAGHEHPRLSVEGVTRPAFLAGPSEAAAVDAALLLVPAFTRTVPGTDVTALCRRDPLTPLLSDPADCRPVVAVDDPGDPLVFPPLSKLAARH